MSTQQIIEIIQKHLRHVQLSPGVGVEKQGYAISVIDDILAEISGLHPAPAGGKGVEERLAKLERNVKILTAWLERIESHPALSVPAVENEFSCLRCPDCSCEYGTNGITWSLCSKHRPEIPAVISSPQRAPAEVEGGESKMLTRSGLSWARRDNEILGITSDGQIGEQVVAGLMLAQASSVVGTHNRAIIKALASAPRGKVPSVEQMARVLHKQNRPHETWEGLDSTQIAAWCGDACHVLALLTEGNARG